IPGHSRSGRYRAQAVPGGRQLYRAIQPDAGGGWGRTGSAEILGDMGDHLRPFVCGGVARPRSLCPASSWSRWSRDRQRGSVLESDSIRDGSEGRSPGGVFWILAQMFVAPFRTFLYGMKMLLESMRSMQTVSDRSIRTMFNADGTPHPPAAPQVPQPFPPA